MLQELGSSESEMSKVKEKANAIVKHILDNI